MSGRGGRGVGRALALLVEGSGRWTALTVVLLAAQSTLPALSLLLLKKIVDAASPLVTGAAGQSDRAHLLVLLALAALVAVLVAVLRSVAAYVETAQSQTITDHVQDALHEQSVRIDVDYYERSQHLDRLHRAQQEAPLRPQLILSAALRLARSAAFLLSVGALLLVTVGWLFPAALAATAVPVVLLRLRHAEEMHAWHRDRTAVERRILYLNWLLTGSTAHAKEVRLFDLGAEIGARSKKLRRQQRAECLRMTGRRAMIDIIANGCETAVVFGAFGILALRAAAGAVTLGDLVMLYQALQRGRDYLQEMLSALSDLYQHNLFLSSFYEFLELRPAITDPPRPRPYPTRVAAGLTLDGVSFRYPVDTRDVLEGVSFAARPGEIVALVGSNGAGKTTLVHLLCRLYDPSAGAIRIEGIDLREMALADLRAHMSVLFQDYARYFFTAGENIGIGDLRAPLDADRIERAARSADAHRFLGSLPRGLETPMGKWLDQGEELSTGQWKKLALARALYRRAAIYIFDEPFDAIDPESETRLIGELRRLARESIVLVISHRMAVCRWADSVVVLQQGRVAQAGNHGELLRIGGEYRDFYERQAAHYRHEHVV